MFLNPSYDDHGYWELRVDDPRVFPDRTGLIALVENWRIRFPTLRKWRVVSAVRAWDKSLIVFANAAVPPNEFDDSVFVAQAGDFTANDNPDDSERHPRVPIQNTFTPPGGPFMGQQLVGPLGGVYLSEYSMHYLGMFMLSSLVRYRPQAWVHAVTRSATADCPADDQALALLEEFMRIHSEIIPGLVATELNP